jgi:hypothetical protein
MALAFLSTGYESGIGAVFKSPKEMYGLHSTAAH